jgi:histone H3/H4
MINHIFSYLKIQTPNIKYEKFNKGIKEINNKKYKLTGGAYHILNMLIFSFTTKITDSCVNIVQYNRHKTITSREVQSIIRLLPKFDIKLVGLMVCGGTQCITSFNAEYDGEYDNNKKKKRNIKKDSNSKLYPRKVEKIMRKYIAADKDISDMRIGIGGPIYLTGALDVIVNELIVGADKYKTSKNVINIDSILNACKNNISLKLLFCEAFI